MSTQEQNTPPRQDGYYWIKAADKWYIAQWENVAPGYWWFAGGNEVPVDDEIIQEIDERKIVRP